MDEKKALELLGLAMRAGQVVSGDGIVERETRASRVSAVLLDMDASENTREKYVTLCHSKRVSMHVISAGALGRAIGKPERIVVAMKPGTLAEKVAALLT